MGNAECRRQNANVIEIPWRPLFCSPPFRLLHSAFCILHSPYPSSLPPRDPRSACNSLKNVSFTSPTGPLRCLAMMSSASPCGLRFFLVVGVVFLAHEQPDQIGVLLDAARFAQVAQARPPARARLRVTVELREHDDRDIQFLGQRLDPGADLRDFELAIVLRAPARSSAGAASSR